VKLEEDLQWADGESEVHIENIFAYADRKTHMRTRRERRPKCKRGG
jgi:hypothetical protein